MAPDRPRGTIGIVFATLGIAACLLTGCSPNAPAGPALGNGSAETRAAMHKVIFDKDLINLMGYEDAASIIEDSREGTEDHYEDIVEGDDGSVEVTYTTAQLEKQRRWCEDGIEDSLSAYRDDTDGGRLEVSNDRRTVSVRITKEAAFSRSGLWTFSSARSLEVYCAQLQILGHPGDPFWDVTLEIIDSKSGKPVRSASLREGGIQDVSPEEWPSA